MEFLCIDGVCVGIIEKKGPFDRLLAFAGHKGHSPEDVVRACCARSLENERRLFFFHCLVVVEGLRGEARLRTYTGLSDHPYCMRKTGLEKGLFRSPRGSVAPTDMYDPVSPWYIGKWFFTTGDRM